jgi:transcriptional regulator with XRE-family HTH domain
VIKQDQNIFYKSFGSLVKRERVKRGHTYASLSKLVGEQNITIRRIEKGHRCSMHHLMWARDYLRINFDDIIGNAIRNKEINDGKKINIEDFI